MADWRVRVAHGWLVESERGQATVEWVGLILTASIVLGGLAGLASGWDGRSLGGLLAHRMSCAVKGGCGDAELLHAYGDRDGADVRRHLQGLVFERGERQLPVDWRTCREVGCATVGDDPDLDAHRTDAGQRATAFTRVQARGGRRYVQYWFYYPDSNTTWAHSSRLWGAVSKLGRLTGAVPGGLPRYPGYHRDDWEGAEARLDGGEGVLVRVTSHGHWQWCKYRRCGHWGPASGWTRVSRGSHAGHVPASRERLPWLPGHHLRERTATADGIRLVPLEGIDLRRYRRLDRGIAPPWEKDAYENPETSES
jgi:hypothetical protein